MSFIELLILIPLVCLAAYLIGRLFATGLMDGINHKFNNFTKFKKDDDKKETK
jgi:hypothetical protein